jgi:hypothetical protein
MPLYDFPADSLAARGVAVCGQRSIGMGPGPANRYTRKWTFRLAVAGIHPAHLEDTYFSFEDAVRAELQVAFFDLIINNADHKGSHILLDRKGNFKLIDHGLCFHIDPKLRTVIWDFSGQTIPEAFITDAQHLAPNWLNPAKFI